MIYDFLKQDGNFFETYEDFTFIRRPALIFNLFASEEKLKFQPDFKETEKIIIECFQFIIKSSKEIPRVEVNLFPMPEYQSFYLKTIRNDESLVDDYLKRALKVFDANKIGPHRYLDVYKNYDEYLTNKAQLDVLSFLRNKENQLEDFELQILKLAKIEDELLARILTVPLNLFMIDCKNLHDNLCARICQLKDKFTQHCVENNREYNKRSVGKNFSYK
jgi:hypothetical protein